jgi:hypothetical protein
MDFGRFSQGSASMVFTNSAASTPKEIADRLLAEQEVIKRYIELVHALRRSVRAYEEQFGIPSSEIHHAIKDGRLVETLDVCEWLMDFEVLSKAEQEWNGS